MASASLTYGGRLSFQSGSVGAVIGESLAANRALRSLHIVGTSAGSFAADACSSAYVRAFAADGPGLYSGNGNAATVNAGGGTATGGNQRAATTGNKRAAVRLTLADPFAAREGASFQSGRGAQLFGRDAVRSTYSLAY